jgi:predicted PurR-regulated permease PerM
MQQIPPPSGTPAATPPEEAIAETAGLPEERQDPPRDPPPPRFARSIPISLAILALLGVIALMHYAASVVITLLSSLLIAMALEPIVQILRRRLRVPRPAGSLIIVTFAMVVLYGLAYTAYTSTRMLLSDLPQLSERVRAAPLVQRFTGRMQELTRTLQEAGRTIAPPQPPEPESEAQEVVVREGGPSWAESLLKGLGSLTTIAFSLSFIPFLVYFILAGKEPLTERSLGLFRPDRREAVRRVVEDIEKMMRRFLLGNAVIAAILSLASVVTFHLFELPYGILLGILSGTTSIVPYIGLFLALAPPVLVGLIAYPTGFPTLFIAAVVTVLHVIAVNLLIPKIVGKEVRLNAVTSLVALIFFGWLWGGMGLLLALPVVAVVKRILENVESTRTFGQWMGDGSDPAL